MSIDINAEIAARKGIVFDQLNAANPDRGQTINDMVEIIEDEFSTVVDTLFDNFDEIFGDGPIALNTYEGLHEEDESIIMKWQGELLNAAIRRTMQKIAVREMEVSGPEGTNGN